MNDHIAHFRIVHASLCSAPPGGLGAGIIRENAHNIDGREILEFQFLRVFDAPAHDKVQQAQWSGSHFGVSKDAHAFA